MWGSLVSQVGSTGTLAPKVAGGERLDTAYRPRFNDRVPIFACAPHMLSARVAAAWLGRRRGNCLYCSISLAWRVNHVRRNRAERDGGAAIFVRRSSLRRVAQ